MNKLVDEAVKVLRELPDDVQAAVASAIIDYSAPPRALLTGVMPPIPF